MEDNSIEKIISEVTADSKRIIIEERLEMWKNTCFQLSLDAQVEKITGGNDNAMETIKQRLASAYKKVIALQKILSDLPKSDE